MTDSAETNAETCAQEETPAEIRKRKILKCAKETLEQGKSPNCRPNPHKAGIYQLVLDVAIIFMSPFVIITASELLKKKIPCAGHFLAPKRLWLKRVSTPNCDVVICFPPNTSDQFLLWLLQKLKQSSGLIVQARHHASTQSSAFYVTASPQVYVQSKKCTTGIHLK